ncbi:hypothetical protein C7H19_08920 [Aphanothece hegewaldii CCALA 016]|uniref:Phosphate-starvation-inducible E-like protein n=1 Tax=Aphanothece hegewaldii CCALA 016 TaxID=2107694 RepID=A0A2T1LZ99_9CHRO|nr:phosphate-starvation-inducible PsiE family protein [Aphanothece hegewaldii]PSF37666.1 hypothetical protein C7H19_08920 [Aphanothece hegewaldii CCALA 016]
MKKSNNFFERFRESFKDESFLEIVHGFEKFTAKILTIVLLFVILVSLFDLVVILFKDVWNSEPIGFFSKTLIEIFGLFLNILIALELLDNITAYLKKNVFHVELVIVTAIIAIARKIIIFDTSKYTSSDLTALGFSMAALTFCYWLVRQVKYDK